MNDAGRSTGEAAGYQVLRKLADGAAAEVYLARAAGSSEQVVLKVLREELTIEPQLVARFLDEARVCQKLAHPNIIRHISSGVSPEGRVYLVTEYLEGEDLRVHLKNRGRLTPEQCIRLMLPLCDALEHVHTQGVVHRDLKPDNVFLPGLLEAYAPKLLDFGLALFEGDRLARTATGVIVATPDYAAPECINGKKADARSDLYALGVLMYEVLTGSPPFVASTYPQLLLKHLNDRPPSLPAECAHLNPIVQVCLAKNPDERFSSAEEVRRALVKAALAPPSEGSEPTYPTPPPGVLARSAAAQAGPRGEVIGSYEVVRGLGKGAMGEVYLARHVRLGRLVALKVLRAEHSRNKELIQRFFREAQSVNQINHEHIVEIFDFIEEPDRVYCVMEFLVGGSLAALLRTQALPISRAVGIVRQVCAALEAAHRVGVVHRDVKPDNIFITERSGIRDYVKVLDFGVAKLVLPIADSPTIETVAGAIIGTPTYMAPEQASGQGSDHRTDVYAVGILLYRILTGSEPFRGANFGHLVVQIMTETPPPTGRVTTGGEPLPRSLEALVLRCLEKDPKKRPSSMAELSSLLEPYISTPELAPSLGQQPGARRSAIVVPAVLVAIAAIAAIGWFARSAVPVEQPQAAAASVAVPSVAAPSAAAPSAAAPSAPPPTSHPVAPSPVVVAVTSTPPGARVSRSDTGETLGTTPLSITVPRLAGRVELKLHLDHYVDAERSVGLDSNVVLDVKLTQAPALPAKKSRPPKEGTNRDDLIDPF